MPNAATDPRLRLSNWTGDFADRQQEHEYRLAGTGANRRQARIMAMIVLVIGWPIILADHLNAADFVYQNELLVARSLGPLYLIALLHTVFADRAYKDLDWLFASFGLYVLIESVILLHVFASEPSVMVARIILFLFVLNSMFPVSGRQRIALSLTSALVIVPGFWLVVDKPAETRASLVVILLAAHILGVATGIWLAQVRRRGFARARRIEAANAELMLAQERLREASETKSIFVANVSHELRTPLNAIIGFSEVLEHQMFGPLGHQKYTEYVGDIRKSGHHLLALINDLLDINRIESGKAIMRPEWAALRDIVPDFALMVREMALSRGQHLVEPEHIPDLQVRVDVRALHQIMVNLLTNASKYAGKQCHIELTIQVLTDGRLRLGVTDDGVGMTEETMTRILNPYETGLNETTSPQSGWGMGLPLARSLALANGIEPRMKSAPGKGTTATVQFPAELVRPNVQEAQAVIDDTAQARA